MSRLTVRHIALITEMNAARRKHISDVEKGYADLASTVAQAFSARNVGNETEARLLINKALDIEFELTGDTELLTELSEDWGVDYERDR